MNTSKTLLVTDEFGDYLASKAELISHLSSLGLGKISSVKVDKNFNCTFLADGLKMIAFTSIEVLFGRCYYEFSGVDFFN